MISSPLDTIFIQKGTDKSSLSHNYSSTYARFFEEFRDKKFSLLEIGIDRGNSLRAWEEYFRNAEIIGIDIEDCIKENTDRIITYQGSQTDTKFLDDVMLQNPLIIIDDGSHDSKDQIFTFEYLFHKLQSGGYYVIEDILCSFDSRWNQGANVMDRIRQMVGEVQMDGNIPGSALCANKSEAVKKYSGSYYDQHIEWIFIACGIVVIKKM